jgi:hypothetical protein
LVARSTRWSSTAGPTLGSFLRGARSLSLRRQCGATRRGVPSRRRLEVTTATNRCADLLEKGGYIKYFLEANDAGELCRERPVDTLWTDIPALRHAPVSERTGYPTQKPRALLERIIRCASPEGGTVVDLFAGSGTTGEAAHALGRTFVLADRGSVAINTARARLLRAEASFAVAECGELPSFEGPTPEVRVLAVEAVEVRVELVRPKEPLGWAIGRPPEAGRPFVSTWHTERHPGVNPVAALPAAVVDVSAFGVGSRAALAAPFEIRVYADDGSVSRVTHASVGSSP